VLIETTRATLKEARVHPLVVDIPRFIQLNMLLLLLKPMGQSRRGVPHMLEARLPEGAPVPPEPELPHALIDPSALRAAKVLKVE
jgi:hypothetical protein